MSPLVVYLLASSLLGVLIGLWARSWGRSFLGWFVLSVLSADLAAGVLYLLGERADQPEDGDPGRTDTLSVSS